MCTPTTSSVRLTSSRRLPRLLAPPRPPELNKQQLCRTALVRSAHMTSDDRAVDVEARLAELIAQLCAGDDSGHQEIETLARARPEALRPFHEQLIGPLVSTQL